MKKRIRKECITRIQNLKPTDISYKIINFINQDSKIGAYCPINNELLIDKILEMNNVYVPYMRLFDNKYIMEYHKYGVDVIDDMHVPSSAGELIRIDELDVIIIPGVAYNMHGYRLGHGLGCYDKALANYKGLKIGVCFDCNIIDEHFEDDYDIQVDYIISEKRIIKTR